MKHLLFTSKAIHSTPACATKVAMQHTHLDAQRLGPGDLEKIENLTGSRFHLDDFVRPTVDNLVTYFNERGTQSLTNVRKETFEFLLDSAKVGSPTNHWTAHYCGLPFGEEYEEYCAIGNDCSRVMDTLSLCDGYLEKELIYFRDEFRPEEAEISVPWRTPDPIPMKSWPRVSLASLGEKFRQVEYHLSLDDIALVSLDALRMLFELPHYTAWKFRNGKYSLVATVQGFDPEIGYILAKVWPWVKSEMAKGGVFKCPVAIKEEIIEGFDVRGNAKLQLVVQPGSDI